MLNIYANPGTAGGDEFNPADILPDEERATLRAANPILDEILAEEKSFVDELWAMLYPPEHYPEMHEASEQYNRPSKHLWDCSFRGIETACAWLSHSLRPSLSYRIRWESTKLSKVDLDTTYKLADEWDIAYHQEEARSRSLKETWGF